MANEPFDASQDSPEVSKIKQCMDWLRFQMAGEVKRAAPLEEELLALGYSHGTIVEARRRLKVRSEKRKDGWYWLPPRAKSLQESS